MRYIIYDSKYNTDPKSSAVLEICDSKEQAEEHKKNHGKDCITEKESLASWQSKTKKIKTCKNNN